MSEESISKNTIKWRDRKHWLWLPWSFTKYEVRNERLYVQRGFFKTEFDETLLYRVMDLKLTRSLGQKICGTGTVTLYTRVDVNNQIELKNIKNPLEVKEFLSDMIENIRNEKKVVGREFSGVMCAEHGDGFEADFDGDMDGEV